jgi:glycolate oxidase FAD binding subunit
MTSSLRREMSSLVSDDGLLPEEPPFGWPNDVPPPAVHLAPGSEEEVAAVLERASKEGWRVLPCGAGTRLEGVCVQEVEILLSTRRLGGMTFYEPADLTFTAGAGIPFGDLQETTGRHGQWVPLDPVGWEKSTVGGMVATGASGPLRYAYGSPRDHVLGLTLVAGDGRILRWGGQVVKNVAGFDVTRLCIGSRGSLGVITSVSARLFPLPEEDRTLLLVGPSMEALLPVARALFASSLPFATLELIDPLGTVWMGDGPGAGPGAGVALRLLGTRPQVEEMDARGRELIADWEGEARRVEVLGAEESRRLFHGVSSWEEGADLVLRLSLLPSRADTLVAKGRTLQEELSRLVGGDVRMALHLGWGVLRFALSGSELAGGNLDPIVKALSELRRELEGEGGSLALSRGPAVLVQELGSFGRIGGEGEIMAGLKREFDPQGILPSGGWGG